MSHQKDGVTVLSNRQTLLHVCLFARDVSGAITLDTQMLDAVDVPLYE